MTDPNKTQDAPADDAPAKNASTDEWRAYAVDQGATEDEVADLSRTELIEKYGEADPAAPTAATDPVESKKAAYVSGESMTAKDAPPTVSAGAEDLPPHLRAAAFHREIPTE